MEVLLESHYTGPTRFQKFLQGMKVVFGARYPFPTSDEDLYPTSAEVSDIEHRGFVLGSVQKYLYDLEGGDPVDVRNAAMLRGAFRDLFSRIEDSGDGPILSYDRD